MKLLIRKYGYKLIAWLVFALSLIYFYYRFSNVGNSLNFKATFLSFDRDSFLIFILAVVLLFANWGIESLKWQLVNKPIEKLGFWLSLKSVFMGVAVSNIFPNRTGEFLGKILVLKKENRIKGVFSSLVSSISQLSITLLAGLWAFMVIKNDTYISSVYVLILSLISALFLILLKPIVRVLKKYIPEKWVSFIDFIKVYTHVDIIALIALSALRYGVFTIQLYLLVIVFGGQLSFLNFIPLSAISFTLTTFIPTTSLSELFVRSNVGLVIFSPYQLDDNTIILAYLCLWMINIMIPSLVGFYFGLKKKWI